MRHADALQPAATTASVRPFPCLTYWVLCLLALAQPAISADAQTLAPLNPRDLLTGDAAAFARLLESARPAAMQKLASVQQVLRTAAHDTVYEVKVIDLAQAAVALHARAVLLISKPAL